MSHVNFEKCHMSLLLIFPPCKMSNLIKVNGHVLCHCHISFDSPVAYH